MGCVPSGFVRFPLNRLSAVVCGFFILSVSLASLSAISVLFVLGFQHTWFLSSRLGMGQLTLLFSRLVCVSLLLHRLGGDILSLCLPALITSLPQLKIMSEVEMACWHRCFCLWSSFGLLVHVQVCRSCMRIVGLISPSHSTHSLYTSPLFLNPPLI